MCDKCQRDYAAMKLRLSFWLSSGQANARDRGPLNLIAAREDIVLDMAKAKAGLPANLRPMAFKRMLLDLGHYVTSPGPGRWELRLQEKQALRLKNKYFRNVVA